MKRIIMLAALVVFLSMNNAPAEELKMPDKHPSVQGGPSQTVPTIDGKVLETMNSGGYTYVNIDQAGKSTWVAVPSMKMEVGQKVSFSQGAVMRNFSSKTLGKTFESIIFSSGVARPSVPALGGTHTGTKKAAPVEKVKVAKAAGPNAHTVEDLYEKRTELNTKSIVVSGKVTKVSQSIMGKNWIHLQDGSGDPSKGNDDIIVTTQDLPAVGDVVTVSGILFKDKDFGSGYKYAVIIEEGKIKK